MIDLRLDTESDFFKNFESLKEKEEKWQWLEIHPYCLCYDTGRVENLSING